MSTRALETPSMMDAPRPAQDGLLAGHVAALSAALPGFHAEASRLLPSWGTRLARTLVAGGRLLAAGNGGSAAEAQHLVGELVGKLDRDRRPLSAIALTADSCGMTAIGNDYGYEQVFARQVRAHARPGDVLMLLSTSGCSPNVLAAADAAAATGIATWGLTGPAPNPLAERCTEALAVPAGDGQVVQELHLMAVHVLCGYVDRALVRAGRDAATEPGGDS